jgi:hypothetical protein
MEDDKKRVEGRFGVEKTKTVLQVFSSHAVQASGRLALVCYLKWTHAITEQYRKGSDNSLGSNSLL